MLPDLVNVSGSGPRPPIKHYFNINQPPVASKDDSVISLHQLLERGGSMSLPKPFSIGLSDRYELAWMFSCALLQVQAGTWLPDRWSAKDIHFVPDKAGMLPRDCIFLEKRFPKSVAAASPADDAALRKLAVRNEHGVVLLELSSLATISSRETESNRKIPALSDRAAAVRLFEEAQAQSHEVPAWNSVVQICLQCGFHEPPDFDRREFRQEYFDNVVSPLHQLYTSAMQSPH